ncbi:MAG: PEPxxWA-CTERM sorting domain-containing protein [Sandaracinobacteroides sp.]
MKFNFVLPAIALVAAGLAAPAAAAIPVYSPFGTVNTESYTFEVANDGDVTGYYLGSITVGYRAVFSYRVNGGAWSATVIDSGPAVGGEFFNLGSFTAGDLFDFRITLTRPVGVAGNEIYSDPALNPVDFLQQVYSTDYAGGDFGVPVGEYTYLAFEDVLGFDDQLRASDFDYNDQRFALTNLGGIVPEPATWAMMIAGFGLVGFAMRRRKAAMTSVAA